MFGKNNITKTINVEGMSCIHCAKKVENALKELREVKSAKVSLENKKVDVTLKEELDDKILKDTIEDLGYKVV